MDRYAAVHASPKGPGDSRPTALQIVQDEGLENKLGDKVIFVTGSSSGLGVETVRALAATGATVYGTARDVAKAQDALGEELLRTGHVHILHLDLNSLASVRACAAEFLAASKNKLNILIANAGVMATPQGKTEDGFETQLGTNHLAHFLLFNLLKPALLASSTPEFQSRVVSVSSSGHAVAGIFFDDLNLEKDYEPWKAYGQSKTANIYMANEIERRYGSQGLHALSLHPGSIYSGLQKFMDPAFVEMITSSPIHQKNRKTTEQGAATTVWAAVAKAWEGKGGKYLDHCQEGKPLPENATMFDTGYAPHAYNPEAEARLWKVSLEMVGLEDDKKV